jgi:Domain of unknown function (DUF4936)
MSAEPARELYLYWKTDRIDQALVAARALQASLRARFDGLQAELLLRPAQDPGLRTLMEVYRLPSGIDPVMQSEIESLGEAALAEVLASARISEVFVADEPPVAP